MNSGPPEWDKVIDPGPPEVNLGPPEQDKVTNPGPPEADSGPPDQDKVTSPVANSGPIKWDKIISRGA